MVRSEPTLVHHDGFLPAAMGHQRVTADELRQSARSQGHLDRDDVRALVLETDGTLSLLPTPPPADGVGPDRQLTG